jgi:uncharacterized protein YndB with AHSA1/START domain
MKQTAATAFAVRRSIHITAPRPRVFELLTDVAEAARWIPITVFEPRLGGRVVFARGEAVAEGEVIEFDPPRSVAYTWDWRDRPLGVRTEVRWELDEDGDGTLVRLSHTGFRDPERRADHEHGWSHYTRRLKTAAEGGDPGPDQLEPRRSVPPAAAATFRRRIQLRAPREEAFAAVSTVEGLARWWTTIVTGSPEPGGVLRFGFEGLDEHIEMRVLDVRAPSSVRWSCVVHTSAPEWPGSTVTFELVPNGQRCELGFEHAGVPPDLVEAGWERFLKSLVAYVESGVGRPFPS